jgi:hypothetical protein
MSHFIYCYAECHNAECRYAECRYAECRYAECRYAECRYAECRGAMILAKHKTFYDRIESRTVVSFRSCHYLSLSP